MRSSARCAGSLQTEGSKPGCGASRCSRCSGSDRGDMSITALIRVDSSVRLGTGHLMRCLSLAEELRRTGVTLTFVCRDLPGNMASLAADRGFPVRMLAHDDPREDTEALLP